MGRHNLDVIIGHSSMMMASKTWKRQNSKTWCLLEQWVFENVPTNPYGPFLLRLLVSNKMLYLNRSIRSQRTKSQEMQGHFLPCLILRSRSTEVCGEIPRLMPAIARAKKITRFSSPDSRFG